MARGCSVAVPAPMEAHEERKFDVMSRPLNFDIDRARMRHLALVHALDGERSLKKAAASLNMRPATASAMLRDLESLFDAKLFVQTGVELIPTEQGEAAIRWASLVLSDLEHAHDNLQAIGKGSQARIRIGISPLAAPTLLPNTLKDFSARYPNAAMKIVTGVDENLLPRLTSGDLDCVMTRLVGREPVDAWRQEILYRDKAVVVVGPDHPLAGQSTISFDDMARYNDWILPLKQRPYLDIAHQLMGPGAPPPRPALLTTSILVILHVLQRNRFMALVPSSVAKEYLALGVICTLPPTPSLETFPIVLLSAPETETLSPAHEYVFALLRHHAKGLSIAEDGPRDPAAPPPPDPLGHGVPSGPA